MSANFFFAGSFFCAVAALCVGQVSFFKNETLYISLGLAVIGSVFIKLGLDAWKKINNKNNEEIINFAQTMAVRLECLEKQLLQNNEMNENNITLLCNQYTEKQVPLLQALANQKEVADNVLLTLKSFENELINEHTQIISKFDGLNGCVDERMQLNTKTLVDFKNEMTKDNLKNNDHIIAYQKSHQDLLKIVKDIIVYTQSISDKTSKLVELNEDANWKKSINKQYRDFSDLKEEIENNFDELKEVLTKLQEEISKQNDANREQLNVLYGKYADVTEKDIKLINKIYDGLKK
ncbi:hypothetical protein SAMN04487864_104257 [Succiniclasticum ruminis]|uniref:Uncharacterized protein n=1 Tax=Succiniclasticum ruminis TaxID=40841 RepID=A0A1G6KI58_9FIRM|nr:hypothetical protein [Succiniclasticum ruminis]SDC30245.1 hypothetical protein SAMN04487864_104257 [Succiniclasticum ruminis]